MTDSLRINTGTKRLLVNDGPDYIEFNPDDVVFAEKFYNLVREFQTKQDEYSARAQDLDNQELDENGIPERVGESLALIREVCEFLCGKIDDLFGPETCRKVFGGAMTLNMFEQFFTGITPFIQRAREEKVSQYVRTKKSGDRKVMK